MPPTNKVRPLEQSLHVLQTPPLCLGDKQHDEDESDESETGVHTKRQGLAKSIRHSQEGHGNKEIEGPVEHGSNGDRCASCPGGVDLRVDGPGQRPKAWSKTGNVEEQGKDGQRCQTVARTVVEEPLPLISVGSVRGKIEGSFFGYLTAVVCQAILADHRAISKPHRAATSAIEVLAIILVPIHAEAALRVAHTTPTVVILTIAIGYRQRRLTGVVHGEEGTGEH